MSGRLNANPYHRQDRIAYTAPGRTFDWRYPPDWVGRRAASYVGIQSGFDRLGGALGGFGAAAERLAEAGHLLADQLSGVADADRQDRYALVDAEGGPADAAEEEEGH